MLTIAKTQVQTRGWPDQPYKGLGFYEPDDAPLFAGRDGDVVECAELLAAPDTRILILHGQTGCGKSSFLRAGLIPFLEDDEMDFGFLKEPEQGKIKAVFVRSTGRPLVELAKKVYDFAGEDLKIRKPGGELRPLGLSEVVAGQTRDEFVATCGGDPGRLIEALGQLAGRLPKTLVLIVDQGEEVLTLKPEGDDAAARNFFAFLGAFSRTGFDLKLLLALRTEYYGKFCARMGRRTVASHNVIQFFLDDLTKEQLVRAIRRPTEDRPVGDFDAPRKTYGFKFEDGLAEKIADDLISKKLTGGLLPVLQVVCDTLYRAKKPAAAGGEARVISMKDYEALGSIEDQVDKHVTESLTRWCVEHGLSGAAAQREIDCWKELLSQLASTQADGTVTTGVIDRETLEQSLKKAGSRLHFGNTVKYLVRDNVRVLRPAGSALTADGEPASFSLGHDAIGLGLHRWHLVLKENEEAEARGRWRVRLYGGVLLGVGLLLLGVVATGLLGSEWGWLVEWMWAILLFTGLYGVIFIVISYTPRTWLGWILYVMLMVYMPLIPKKRLAEMLKQKEIRGMLQLHPDLLARVRRKLE